MKEDGTHLMLCLTVPLRAPDFSLGAPTGFFLGPCLSSLTNEQKVASMKTWIVRSLVQACNSGYVGCCREDDGKF